MQDWSTSLIVAAAVFLGAVLWRVRPALGPRRRASREALREARARIESACDEHSRARALCDAADVVAKSLRGTAKASGLYFRAMRSDPQSVEVVQRVVTALARRPRALESLLWRHLAIARWSGESQGATRLALETLRALYDGPLKNAVRARALANALELMPTTST